MDQRRHGTLPSISNGSPGRLDHLSRLVTLADRHVVRSVLQYSPLPILTLSSRGNYRNGSSHSWRRERVRLDDRYRSGVDGTEEGGEEEGR
jgi:hypothetical protein